MSSFSVGVFKRGKGQSIKNEVFKGLNINRNVGAIFPIRPDLMDRILVENRYVFVKYLARNNVRIAPKDKVLFYVSHS